MTAELDRALPAVRLANEAVWEAVLPRLRELVVRGDFTLGTAVDEFEQAAAAHFGSPWAVALSSGTAALQLALRAAPLSAPARVALPANTFFATFEAVLAAGHVPVLVDHDEDLLLSAATMAGLEVDAVVPVHLYGLPVDMTGLMAQAAEQGWWVLEDASQAHGAEVGGRPVGSLGHAAAFSAYPTKNLGAWGDAGFVTGIDPRLEDLLRSLRHHGHGGPGRHVLVGGTHRMDSIQALVLTEKLSRLEEEVRRRREVAAWYREALDGLDLALPGDRGDRSHAYHQFVVRVPRRAEVRARLAEQGIETAVHYPVPVHRQPAAQGRCAVPRPLHRAEQSAAEVLSLPMRPGLRPGDVERVATGLRAALRSGTQPALP